MGQKKSSLSMRDMKLSTVMGSCGLSSCRSSCCEEGDKKEEEDPQLKQIRIAMKVEMMLIEKLILERMMESLKKDGIVPDINIVPLGGKTPESPKRSINVRF